ncbi:MAG TPA: GNAT family N-acetyltransferase [Gemmataceae bacterium]|nr:GNAT family N-acetyltransferase [Gemmataceae bacterium]
MMSVQETPKPTKKSANPPAAAASVKMHVVAVEDVAALQRHVPAWENLAAAAVEPNAFYEPWMLLPALKHFATGPKPFFVLVYEPDANHPDSPGSLLGFFPLQRQGRYKGLPLPHLQLWRHLHSVLATPLIRAGYGHATLRAVFEWLRTEKRGSGLLKLDFVSADGPFHQLLVNHLNEETRLTFVEETTTRALLRVSDDAEEYVKSTMSGGNRKELRRQRRRLGELGQLESRVLHQSDDAEKWIDQFLQLEASGWKGQHGTALRDHESEGDFFRTIAREAFARGRLMMLGLFLDGQPIALKCNFLMGEGSIAFKIAFDEDYARFSPGVQLELDNIAEAHARVGLRWMDSCAISRHFMINRLWKERRVMQNVLVATGRRGGDLVVSALPLLRWLQRLVRRKPPSGEST